MTHSCQSGRRCRIRTDRGTPAGRVRGGEFHAHAAPARLDTPHALHVVANTVLVIPEASALNNQQVLQAGGIAAPGGLWAELEPGSHLVFLSWDAVADRRVAGYRVYRTNARAAPKVIGSSFAPGYVALNTTDGQAASYSISAYTADGVESPLGASVRVSVPTGNPPARIYLPLVLRPR